MSTVITLSVGKTAKTQQSSIVISAVL